MMQYGKLPIWDKNEYGYSGGNGFIPFLMPYIHTDISVRPCILVVPGGAYRVVAPSEGEMIAHFFYNKGFHAFVLTYSTDFFMRHPLKLQPLQDISRALRVIRASAHSMHIASDKIAVCGSSAGAHLCASLCVHSADIFDLDPTLNSYSNCPDAAILCYPVISFLKNPHKETTQALLGKYPSAAELEYMSLEKYVQKDTPPCFLWQTKTDDIVSIFHSYYYALACEKAGVSFSHHVFSQGPHGLSLSNDQWINEDFGIPYSMEQSFLQLETLCRTHILSTEEAGQAKEELHKVIHPGYSATEREELQQVILETGVWPQLALQWLKKELKI